MSKKKVNLQDIADALGLSRNTVSKALNGNKSVPEATRNKVIKKAISLKYKQFAFMNTENLITKKTGNIALLTRQLPTNSHFGSSLLSGLEKRISSEGYNLSIHILRETEFNSLALPNNFDKSSVNGIICIELFDKKYTQLVNNLGIPTIFIDTTSNILYPDLNADILLMENEHSTYLITKKLIDSGHNKIGFVGDYTHCKSFNERWVGFNRALLEYNLQLDLSLCITEDDNYPYTDPQWMKKQLDNMKVLPSAFVCANDFIAVSAMSALKSKNIKIPEDIVVCGFDDTPESRVIEPNLTTVHIFNIDMGIIAAEMLLARIKNPTKPSQITYVKTEPIFRASTGKLSDLNR
ncbi:LacI family DNA-binding transcriptional regulator [Clostridium sp. SYSU_GA19001]|uniref:LacI family DNA-binding transcriptional regulator n=1 Tax=Clostridium caldaquaticum TaxID=2940653 RepID=UPI00207790A0|nr:LacI family DNA-binding transcriptional regulator [Clostridium caldaquaticum]MCM8711848.1 LacI family DNA-binding transcriptional regulator [Clostridium caldaquaticum]